MRAHAITAGQSIVRPRRFASGGFLGLLARYVKVCGQ